MSVAHALIIVAQTSPVAIQSSPTPGPVGLAPAAQARSALVPPASDHPSAMNTYITLGLGRMRRRALRSPNEFAAVVASPPMTVRGSSAPKAASNGWTYQDASVESMNAQAKKTG
jgi:hypothetical protein